MSIAQLCESEMKWTNENVEAILDKTVMDADVDQDGKIDRSEWQNFVSRNPPLLKIMTLPYLRDITMAFPSFVFCSEVDEVATKERACSIVVISHGWLENFWLDLLIKSTYVKRMLILRVWM
ncbi:calcineurin B-like protein 9 [Tripterygium wilfordii]|uniref:Calcineurin B-like protein n=1 Tax=Tripterygium wilfordii TaxID=458696 RepID=A0A7J7DSR4_TRIWF|nr:calcineurin B-like protein 9 [Tripterygium wilfordii]